MHCIRRGGLWNVWMSLVLYPSLHSSFDFFYAKLPRFSKVSSMAVHEPLGSIGPYDSVKLATYTSSNKSCSIG